MGVVDMFILYPWVGIKIIRKSISGKIYPCFSPLKFSKVWNCDSYCLIELNLNVRLKALFGNLYFVNSVLLLVPSQSLVSWFVLGFPWKLSIYDYYSYNSYLFSVTMTSVTIILSGRVVFISVSVYTLTNLIWKPWLLFFCNRWQIWLVLLLDQVVLIGYFLLFFTRKVCWDP